MDFTEAMHNLEKGKKIKRPNWAGFLFLDVDGNIKHAGNRSNGEKFWSLDTGKEDWEVLKKSDEDAVDASGRIELESHEVTQSRLEAMMDATACHIKRLYYLEEIIKGQHTAMKSMSDNFITEMEETRKALAKTVAAIPRIEEKLAKLSGDFFNLELREMVKSYKKMIAEAKEEKKAALAGAKAKRGPKPEVQAKESQKEKNEDSTSEMEEVRDNLLKRKDLKKLKGLKRGRKSKGKLKC